MAGIVARLPAPPPRSLRSGRFKQSVFTLGGPAPADIELRELCAVLLFIVVVVAVIAITKGQRRIPTQSAKHVRGRVFGGS